MAHSKLAKNEKFIQIAICTNGNLERIFALTNTGRIFIKPCIAHKHWDEVEQDDIQAN